MEIHTGNTFNYLDFGKLGIASQLYWFILYPNLCGVN